MSTKVGEGYIEIKPKLVGFNRDLLRDARARIREIEAASKEASASLTVKPKISGITKVWQREIQQELNSKINGLTVDVKVKLENNSLKATFKDVSVQDLVNDIRDLSNGVEGFGRDSDKATKQFVRGIEESIRATDRMVDRIRTTKVDDKSSAVWGLASSLESEIKDANTIADALFPDLSERIVKHGAKAGGGFSSGFGAALKRNLFDNAAEGVLALAGQFFLAVQLAQPLLSALSNLSAGLLELGTVVVDVYGAFLALPAVWAAVTQAGAVLTAALFGVQDAVSALMNEQQHAVSNAASQAKQIASAQEQIADAKERLKRTVESVNESIERAEEALSDATQAAAKRIADAQERVSAAHAGAAEAVENATARIADAQKALSRAYESAADRIASAEKRHADAINRVKDAQLDLNQAYKDALERFEDLNIALGNGVLDEEGARLAIERAKERLDQVIGDPTASDRDKREADLAYREALHRLAEIEERNADLRKEIEEANKSGVEGSREVTSAKEKLLEAQRAEIEAQAEIAKAHKEAAEQIIEAQARVAEAQADAVKAQLDAAKRVADAEKDLAEARIDATKSVQKAQEDLAEAHKDASRTIADANKDVARAIENLTEAQNKQNQQWYNAQAALAQLSPEARKFVLYLVDVLLPRLRDVQWAIQDAFFPPLQRALEQSGGLIDLFQAKLTVTAGLFGQLIGKTIEWLNTPETQNSLGIILDTNNRLFGLLGEAGLNFADVLLTLTEAAGPFLLDMGQLLTDFSAWLEKVTSSKEGREELNQFFKNVSETIHEVYAIAQLVGDALYKVYKMARPYGQELLGDIKEIAQKFDDWVNSTEGQTEIEKFLRNGKKFLQEVLKLIEDVSKAFVELGANNDLSGAIKSIRDDLLPALLRVIDAFGGGSQGGGFVLMIKVVSVALNIFASNVSLVAAAVSALGAIFTGDWSGARASFADFLDSARANTITVFGDVLPSNFKESSKAYNDSVRGMQDDREMWDKGLAGSTQTARDWASGTAGATANISGSFSTMASEVNTSTGKYATDVDEKTRQAREKADRNSKDTKDAILLNLNQMRIQNELDMERYRQTVDQKTKDAKDSSSRNIGDLVKDSRNLLMPFGGIFESAAKSAQEKMKNPGASWWDVGKSIIDGLWEGVKALIPNFITSIWNLGIDIVNTIRKALDSRSPSRKMFKVGESVGEGLALGVESMTEKVGRASEKLGKSVVDSFGSPALSVDVGSTGRKVIPTLGDASALSGGARTVNYITVNAAPNVPTEKQISNVLKQQEVLYDN